MGSLHEVSAAAAHFSLKVDQYPLLYYQCKKEKIDD